MLAFKLKVVLKLHLKICKPNDVKALKVKSHTFEGIKSVILRRTSTCLEKKQRLK